MKYYSTNRTAPDASFRDAVIRGLAPDRGLYFPERIDRLPDNWIKTLPGRSFADIGFAVARTFVDGEIPEHALEDLVHDVLAFDTPLVPVEDNVWALELFHGPTLAFKDVGARFMARCLGHFMQSESNEVTVLVATSGDTGSAVAHGFLGVEGVNVVILYPSGKVSAIQEQQLTTLGQNITTLEVAGTFDDCQHMVKQAFVDEEITSQRKLTSANSINIARFLPQSFYYFHGYAQLPREDSPVYFSVPSGNFGNLTAGMVAKRMGLPIAGFVASTNVNNIVPSYLSSGRYEPKPSQPTISNAMDVGDPSNFVRMQELHNQSVESMRGDVAGYSYTDDETRAAIASIAANGYVPDPHGAVGYLGMKAFMAENPGRGIFLETAHPAKFKDVVEGAIGREIPLPQSLADAMAKEKQAIKVGNTPEDLKAFLLG